MTSPPTAERRPVARAASQKITGGRSAHSLEPTTDTPADAAPYRRQLQAAARIAADRDLFLVLLDAEARAYVRGYQACQDDAWARAQEVVRNAAADMGVKAARERAAARWSA